MVPPRRLPNEGFKRRNFERTPFFSLTHRYVRWNEQVERGLIMICEGPFSKRKVAEVEYMNTTTNVAMELDGKRIHYQVPGTVL